MKILQSILQYNIDEIELGIYFNATEFKFILEKLGLSCDQYNHFRAEMLAIMPYKKK